MKNRKRRRLEDAGWRVGSAAEFLQLSPEEAALVEIRLRLACGIRELRKKKRLSQQEIAEKIGSSQSRVAKMEKADVSVSLDLMVRTILALGTTPKDVGRLIAAAAA